MRLPRFSVNSFRRKNTLFTQNLFPFVINRIQRSERGFDVNKTPLTNSVLGY